MIKEPTEVKKAILKIRSVLSEMGFTVQSEYPSRFVNTDKSGKVYSLNLEEHRQYRYGYQSTSVLTHFKISGTTVFDTRIQKIMGKNNRKAPQCMIPIANLPSDDIIREKIQAIADEEMAYVRIRDQIKQEDEDREAMINFHQESVYPEWKDSVRVTGPSTIVIHTVNAKELSTVIQRINNIPREKKKEY